MSKKRKGHHQTPNSAHLNHIPRYAEDAKPTFVGRFCLQVEHTSDEFEELYGKLCFLLNQNGHSEKNWHGYQDSVEYLVGVVHDQSRWSHVPQHTDDHDRPIHGVGGVHTFVLLDVVDILEESVVGSLKW